jgi:hypothetical protein
MKLDRHHAIFHNLQEPLKTFVVVGKDAFDLISEIESNIHYIYDDLGMGERMEIIFALLATRRGTLPNYVQHPLPITDKHKSGGGLGAVWEDRGVYHYNEPEWAITLHTGKENHNG